MGVIVVDLVEPDTFPGTVTKEISVVDVVIEDNTLIETNISNHASVEVVKPGGYVANVQWGYEYPAHPTEGQLFIKFTP
jgi:hypothetical protein